MSYQKNREKYIDLKINGRLFPTWVLANFPKFKLPEIIQDESYDGCSKTAEDRLREYQVFVSKYLDYNSPFHDILIYHGVGSGKTASTINIYNMLYNYTPAWNVYILLKATLRDDPWITGLEEWLSTNEKQFRFQN